MALVALAIAPAGAQSHDHGRHGDGAGVVQTSPADGAMGAAPASFSATFAHPMRMTTLVITPRGGEPLAVSVPEATAATTVNVPLPQLAPGNYTLTWTAIGADGHTMTGRVRYMVH
jgi:methionine-rich copper-binding protein CopC